MINYPSYMVGLIASFFVSMVYGFAVDNTQMFSFCFGALVSSITILVIFLLIKNKKDA